MATAKSPQSRKASSAPEARPGAKSGSTGGVSAWSIGAVALAAGAGLVVLLTRGRIAGLLGGAAEEGHVPTDLLDPDHNADDRAIAAFRPDMNAAMTAGERAALAPATGPAPTLVADRGSMNGQTAPAN